MLSTTHTLHSVNPGREWRLSSGTLGQAQITQLICGAATSQTHIRLTPRATEGKLGQMSVLKSTSGKERSAGSDVTEESRRRECRRKPPMW